MNSKKLKEELLHQCQTYVEQRLHRVNLTIIDIQESLTSETKSSAGDKHETGRAMIQLEREKAGQQLAEANKLQGVLSRINIASTSKTIHLGSLVYTSVGNYFISISVNPLTISNTIYYAIAANSPIGKLLLGKTVGDCVAFNDKKITIKKVY